MKRSSRACDRLWLAAAVATLVLGSIGCATQEKVLKAPHFTLTHPDYWKVNKVATTDGEETLVVIGKYSETVINEGVGAADDAVYESSMSDVEVRIFGWPAPDEAAPPSRQVANLLSKDGTLQLSQHGLISGERAECGQEFKRKYKVFGAEQDALDLLKRPGFRTIIVGSKNNGVLYGVVARVPFEQDEGLYCYNLRNMQTQLGMLLEKLQPAAAAPAAPAAPATPAAPAAPADPAAAPAATPPAS